MAATIEEDRQAFVSLGRTPISDSSPAGNSVRYDPEFETLNEEIQKLSSVAAGTVDWTTIVRLATDILREKSKDLLVASYLCAGLFESEGYSGLGKGLAIIRDMMCDYWESMFPEPRRARARGAAIDWLAERLVKRISDRKPISADQESIEASLAMLAEIESLADEKLGDHAPLLGELRRTLQGHARMLADRPQQTQPKQQETSSAAAPDAMPSELSSDADARKALNACKASLISLANYYRSRNLADPRSYRLVRTAAWLSIQDVPPNQDAVTELSRRIPDNRLRELQEMLEGGEYEGLIPEVESQLVNDPFWLDGHRLSANALEALGAPYAAARRAVLKSFGACLRRLPDLLDLKFANGTPFADDLTRLWIQNEVLADGHAEETDAHAGPEEAQAPWLSAYQEAKALAAKGKSQEGLKLFADGRRNAAGHRERFMWELAQARYCYEAGYATLAVPVLEYLDDQVERYAIDEWEPTLALEIARLMLTCHASAKRGKSEFPAIKEERLARLRARLCRLDASVALALNKS